MSSAPLSVPSSSYSISCTCGATSYIGAAATTKSRGHRLVRLDRAVVEGQVTCAAGQWSRRSGVPREVLGVSLRRAMLGPGTLSTSSGSARGCGEAVGTGP